MQNEYKGYQGNMLTSFIISALAIAAVVALTVLMVNAKF